MPEQEKDTQEHCCNCEKCNCQKQEHSGFVSGAEDMTLTTSDKAKINDYHKQTS